MAPSRQPPWRDLELRELLVRTRTDPETVVRDIRTEVRKINPDVPVYAAAPMTRTLAGSLDRPRFAMDLMGFFAVISLALASLGLYGVLAYAVGQRTKEFGIRMALGADRTRLLTMVIREGTALAAAGIVLGIAGSLAAARFLSTLLVGISATDARTFVGVAVVLIVVAIAASYLPARRAMKVDPMVALRHE
jgi:putative ABC transport system permease protein